MNLTYIFKFNNILWLQTNNAYNKIHVDWDCIDTDIEGATPITTITDISQPISRHPQNLKHSIISYTSGLPGHLIVYIWRSKNESV